MTIVRRVRTVAAIAAGAAAVFVADSLGQCPPAAGWRTDGTGRYADAQPPLTWSPTANVVWKTPMPGRSSATPVIADGRIFVCSEPTTLICVLLSDGKILWQRTNSYVDILLPEEIDKARQEEAKAHEIRKQLTAVQNKHSQAANKLRQTPADEALKKEAEDLKAQVASAREALKPLEKWLPPPLHDVTGYSTPTPVCDGGNVYALFGTGTAVCYDLQGNRKWARTVERPNHQWGHSASPVLVGDKLIVQIQGIHALDIQTGNTVWQGKPQAKMTAGSVFGTPLYTRPGGVDIVLTAGGDALRVSDGKVLASGLGLDYGYCSPIIHDNVVYFIDNGRKAVRLTEPAGDKLTPEVVWKAEPDKDIHYCSPVCHDGLLYTVNYQAVLSVIDASDGALVYTRKLGVKGDAYASAALAGGNIHVSVGATTFVIQPGREYKQLAENKLEDFRGSPVFLGKRMYIRGLNNLYCIGE